MCYAKPAPRCSGHAKQELKVAREKLEAAKQSGDRHKVAIARAEYDEAMEDFYQSPAGIARFEKKAKEATDPQEALRHRHDAKYYSELRAAKVANYHRVKDLPVERRHWVYDDEGYAESSQVVQDTSCDPLYEVHNGAGEDYLAKNQLTEVYGWTTSDAEGDEEEPIYVKTPEGPSAYAVRSVELHNVSKGREGERATVYRLDDGDGRFSTFGSREEAGASLQGEVGLVVDQGTYQSLKRAQSEEQAALEAGDEW